MKGQPSLTADQLRKMGESYLAAGDYGQALTLLTQAEAKRPNDPVTQYDLGLAYDERGMASEALVHLQKALTLKPDYSDAYNALGRYYARQNQLDSAQEAFEKALSNPFYSSPHLALFNLGLVYEKKGNREEALKQYEEAVRLQPAYGIAYFRIGQNTEELGREDDARRAYGKAIQYAPEMTEAHFRYGVLSYNAGEWEPAQFSLNRVVKLEPYSPMADEARKYLARMQSGGTGSSPRAPERAPSRKSSHFQPVGDQDLKRPQVQAVEPEKLPAEQEQPAARPSLPESPREVRVQPQTTTSHEGKQWVYIVQVASYRSKKNMEEAKKKLEAKGFDVVVKEVDSKTSESLFVLQLKPVDDAAKAEAMLKGIQGVTDLKPIILKVSAGK
jgi:type IV pilus assembly protein PilF